MHDDDTRRPTEVERYLSRFGHGRTISISELWAEMDRVWDEYQLDNRKALSAQDVSSFYSHPVWILNGLFSASDPLSIQHRKAIAAYIDKYADDKAGMVRVADCGGGCGVLADVISRSSRNVDVVDIVEPWVFDYFTAQYEDNKKIRFKGEFSGERYDVVIAQDVLEHVDDPIDVAIGCVEAVEQGGLAIFANCFAPVIKCHLPSTFYLRYSFRHVVCSDSLRYVGVVPGAAHAQVFKKIGRVDPDGIRQRARRARVYGPVLNGMSRAVSSLLGPLRRRDPTS